MFDLNQIYRKVVLGVAHQTSIEHIIRNKKSIAERFVAGNTLADALDALERLRDEGILGILDLLGEMVTTPEQAHAFTREILRALDGLSARNLSPQISIKLSQIGQDIRVADGRNLSESQAELILSKAAEMGGFVCLDMEDHMRVDSTLQQFAQLHSKFPNHIGTVLQAYLYRTENDLRILGERAPNLRIVKGAYLEPEEVAYTDKRDVDLQYRRLIYAHMDAGHYTCVATHDESLIEDIKLFVDRKGIAWDRFEFQMLYGVRTKLQKQLVLEGYTVRAYVPYGRDWYAYFSRRIAERPANIGFVLRGLFKG